MPKQIKNAWELNHIIASLKRSTGVWGYTLTVHGSNKLTGTIDLTKEQFDQLQEQMELKEESSLTSDTGKVYLINP